MGKRLGFLVSALFIAGPVSAQLVPPDSGIKREALPTVFVLDNRGVETRGQLLKLDDESIELAVGNDRRRFDTRSVVRVSKRGDSLKNGAVIGAVIGLTLGVFTSGMAECPSPGGQGYGSCGPGARIAVVALSGALYSAIGTTVDAMIPGRTTLYAAPAARAAATPARGAAFALRLRW